MNDDVAGIDQDPVTLSDSLGFDPDQPFALEGLYQILGKRNHLARRSPGCNHHVITNRRFAIQIDYNNVFGLMIIQHLSDQKIERRRADGGFFFCLGFTRLGQ